MAYLAVPRTKFEWIDNSQAPVVPTETISYPVYLCVFSADKGTEDFFVADKKTFPSQYLPDNIASFNKHGQALIQAAQIAAAGGQVLCKRVVADDAHLANKTISARITVVNEQKKDKDDNLLYIDATTGKETTVAIDNRPLMVNNVTVKYVAESFKNCSDIGDVSLLVENKLKINKDTNEYYIPLIVFADNGRGKSAKKFRISPDYKKSKRLDNMKYTLEVLENDNRLESMTFCGNLDIIESNTNRSLGNIVNTLSSQIKCEVLEDNYIQFIEILSELTGIEYNELINQDFFFGKTRRQVDLPNITIDYTSPDATNLSYSFGISLDNGDNGEFGSFPIKSKTLSQKLLEVFNGTFSAEIYDLDNHKLDIIPDANYPAPVKRAIEALVTYREDLTYIRDLGLGLTTIDDIEAANEECLKNRYCDTYHLSYSILDPYTKKPITVTMVYELSLLLVDHFLNGRGRPLAGQQYGFILNKCIKGTESFIPKVTPEEDQKERLCEMGVNYAAYYDNNLVLETQLTSQVESTQLSNINNVLLMQQIVKAVRTRCPKIRYSFIEGGDLSTYTRDVQDILDKFSSNFKQLKLVYLEDDTMKENKIYYAAILCVFKDFVQQEYFKLYALNDLPEEYK